MAGDFDPFGSLASHFMAHAAMNVPSGALPSGADPTATIGLSAVNGSATTFLRSDGAPALSQGIVPTWTGVHTFSSEAVFNGGLDIGTSGRFDSNVANAASAITFLFKPTTALTAGQDRQIAQIQDSSGNIAMSINADRTIGFNSVGVASGLVGISGTIPSGPYYGINFAPTAFTSTGTIIASTGYAGALFTCPSPTSTSNVSYAGHFLVNTSVFGESAAILAQTVRSGTGSGNGLLCAIKMIDVSTSTKGAVTDFIGLYGSSIGSLPIATNRYWIYLNEITSGSGNVNEVFIGGGGEIFFRDQAIHVGSLTDGHLDLTADTSIDMNGDVDISAKNIITDTTTGTKIATGTTQKLGFWNAAPVVQQTTGITAATFVTNTSLIANDTATWDGYTIGQVVAALRLYGILA